MGLSKVKSCQGAGDWSNEHGTFYKFEYAMEDGTVLTASHKKQEGFPIGAEIEYEIKGTNDHGSYGSVKKPDSGNYSGSNASKGGGDDSARQLMIVRQSSLNRAVEILCHNSAIGAKPNQVDPVDVVELAGRLAKWVMQTPKQEPEAQPEKVAEVVANSGIGQPGVQQPNPANPDSVTDDLPF